MSEKESVNPSEPEPVNRRGFLSSSFVLGLAGGIGVGAVARPIAEKLTDPLYHERSGRISFAQGGEDLIIAGVANFLDVYKPEKDIRMTYLDIGAADPVAGNNTYYFYKFGGCRGVLVEPNPMHVANLKKGRPGDTVLPVGIGDDNVTEADYYLIGGPGGDALNTFDKETADAVKTKTNGMHFVEKVIKMPLVHINDVLDKHFHDRAPNLLSIDCEGFDIRILKALDFKRYRPDIICAETLVYGTTKVEQAILDVMTDRGYVIRGGNFVNTVFVDKRFFA
jgi:FkbM family methyltransferase